MTPEQMVIETMMAGTLMALWLTFVLASWGRKPEENLVLMICIYVPIAFLIVQLAVSLKGVV